MPGQLIRMFLADGRAEGIKTLEVANQTIFCTVFPRPMFEQFKIRKENDPSNVYTRPGVYILMGFDDVDENGKIYIGEGDPVGDRLYAHYGKKDFWTDALVFTSKDGYITKTQIQYIESKLIKTAKDCNQVLLDNGNMPQLPNISEVDEAEVSGFLESILLLIKALGYTFFVPLTVPEKEPVIEEEEPSIIFELKQNKKIAHGKMIIRQGKYVLLKGSIAVKDERASSSEGVKNHRRKLIEKQIFVENEGNTLKLMADTEFNSASTAASIIVGGSMNGLRAWKHNGQTLAEYETSALEME